MDRRDFEILLLLFVGILLVLTSTRDLTRKDPNEAKVEARSVPGRVAIAPTRARRTLRAE